MSAATILEPITATFADQLPALGGATFRLVDSLLADKSEATRRGYLSDLQTFARFHGHDNVETAAQAFIRLRQGAANTVILNWRASMMAANLSSSTINRRLATLRSLVNVASMQELTTIRIHVKGLRPEPVRDNSGPDVDTVGRMLAACELRGDAKGLRDAAIIRVTVGCGLRRSELLGLDLEHVDQAGGKIAIMGKGKRARASYTLPPDAARALAAWLEVRGREPGPVFVACNRAGRPIPGQRLSGQGLGEVLKALSGVLGVKVRPHGLRHTAISEAMEMTNGNVDKCQKFSRHESVDVLMKYVDARRDNFGIVARLVDARLSAAVAGVC
jgi:integrase/recombinase XerC